MRKIGIILASSLFLIACNSNPNKEERIHNLETGLKEYKEKTKKLETQIHLLEVQNLELKKKLEELDKME